MSVNALAALLGFQDSYVFDGWQVYCLSAPILSQKERPQGQPSFRLSSGRPGKGGVLMRRLWHVLEVVAIYALKRLIDWFFTTKN